MGEEKKREKGIFGTQHVSLAASCVYFSVVLIVLICVLRWEFWMIPVVAAFVITVFMLYVTRALTIRQRVYIYSIVLIIEIFYFTVHMEFIYETTAMIILSIMIIATTGERFLFVLSFLVGLFSMLYHMLTESGESFKSIDTMTVVHVILPFSMVVLAGIVAGYTASKMREITGEFDAEIAEVEKEQANTLDFFEDTARILIQEAKNGRDVSKGLEVELEYIHLLRGEIGVENRRYKTSELFMEDYHISPEVEVKFEYDKSLPDELVGDVEKIKKIIEYLCDQAMVHTKKGGMYFRIYARQRDYGVNLCIDAEDTGEGMDRDIVEKIFAMRRWDGEIAITKGAIGAEFFIINGYLDMMGGFMKGFSAPDAGVKTMITIPQGVWSGDTPLEE